MWINLLFQSAKSHVPKKYRRISFFSSALSSNESALSQYSAREVRFSWSNTLQTSKAGFAKNQTLPEENKGQKCASFFYGINRFVAPPRNMFDMQFEGAVSRPYV